jgi:uncharacterized Zn finger protein (UPF0148 family)
VVSEAQKELLFGTDIVCRECGVPKPRRRFTGDSIVCKSCTPKLLKRAEMEISPEEHFHNNFRDKLSGLRRTADPMVTNGIQKAIKKLGQSPQEAAVDCIKQMLEPRNGDGSGMSVEQRAACRTDYKTIKGLLSMLQEAQFFHDKQLEDANPYDNVDPDHLRSIVLKGTIDQAQTDKDLRGQLIQAFLDRCPSFYEEVVEAVESRGGLPKVEVR